MLLKAGNVSWLATYLSFTNLVSAQNVKTKGVGFELGNKPYTFAGANLWTLGCSSDAFVDHAMTAIKKIGYEVIRVAAFIQIDHANNLLGSFGAIGEAYFQSWANGQPTINYGANGLQLMDYAVRQAEINAVRYTMILSNEWFNYGGMDTWVLNIKGPGQCRDLFYTDPTIKAAFKKYISVIINRYKHSSAIFAWELANEPRCVSAACTGGTLTQWADEMSTYIKSIDANHMVTWGGCGFLNKGNTAQHGWDFAYDGGSGEDSEALLKLKNIDFGTVHLYTNDNGAQGPAYGLQWLKDHNDIAVAKKKPMVVEEMAVSRSGAGLDMVNTMNDYQDYIISAPAIAGSMDWSSLSVDSSCPTGGDVYALCSTDPFWKELVMKFGPKMKAKAGTSRVNATHSTKGSSSTKHHHSRIRRRHIHLLS